MSLAADPARYPAAAGRREIILDLVRGLSAALYRDSTVKSGAIGNTNVRILKGGERD